MNYQYSSAVLSFWRDTTFSDNDGAADAFTLRLDASGANILEAQERGVDLVAPITSGSPPNLERMQLSDFEVTADGRQVLAPTEFVGDPVPALAAVAEFESCGPAHCDRV